MGATRFECTQNHLQYRLSLLKHLVVPEPKQTKSFSSNSAVAMLIIATTIHVLSAIELDHKLRFETREIGDIAADGHLATETIATQLAPP